jgi:glycosyltransferase involved in cell wall biosynthesis
MKLLVDCHVFDGKFQGTRTYIQGLYSALINHFDIEFYFAAQDTENLKSVFGSQENIHYIKLNSGGSIKRLFWEFPQIINEYGIDYAHFQYVGPFKKCCKEIVTIHDVLFLDFPQFFPILYRIKNGTLFRFAAKRADILLTVSEYSRNAISKHFAIDKDFICVTPNAVLPCEGVCENTGICEKDGLDKFLLSVGRVEPRKNFLSLLRAFVELSLYQEGYKLVFVGVPDLQYKEFNRYYESLPQKIKDCVLFFKASFAELVELYKKTSLFVFPSYAEGFGVPPIEAIEYGAPILCSNATAMAEFGLPEQMLFDPYDLESLKKKILECKDRPLNGELINEMREKFNWEISAKRLYSLLQQKG